MDMDIRKLVREILVNEFSEEEFGMLKTQYADARIILSHDEEIGFRPQVGNQRTTYKPKGLWYGFGDSWMEWVKNEMPNRYEAYDHIHLIEVNQGALLSMGTMEELLSFTKKYSPTHNRTAVRSDHFERNMIDWDLVSQDYDGIEINPYVYEARMDERTNWYYPWDVASGCIWKKSAIRSVTKIN